MAIKREPESEIDTGEWPVPIDDPVEPTDWVDRFTMFGWWAVFIGSFLGGSILVILLLAQ